ncbi:Probable RNA helicase armi [Sergentomyia squamirostris]
MKSCFLFQVLSYLSIDPVRTVVEEGVVTKVLPSGGGRINKNIFFTPETQLESNYKPQVEDVVAFEAIENYDNNCEWRCLKMVMCSKPQQQVAKNRVEAVVSNGRAVEVDERGIVIEEVPEIHLENIGDKTQIDIKIKNTNTQRHKLLKTIIPVSRKMSQLEVLTPHVDAQIFFNPGHEEIFKIEVVGKMCGYWVEKIVWKFGGGLSIERKITIQVGSDDVDLTPREVFSQRQPRHGLRNGYNVDDYDRKDVDVIRGGALMRSSGIAPKVIEQYLVPQHLKRLIVHAKDKFEAEDKVFQAYPVLGQPLNLRTYTGIFHNLLYIEEIQLWVDFRIYDRNEVFFKRQDKEYLSLEVDNVAETRPSLILGDIIRITSPYSTQRAYEGYVHKIEKDRVLVKFERNFQNSYNGEKYNVTFNYSRGNLRKLHHAVGKILPHLGDCVVFPTKVELKPPQIDVVLNDQGDMVDQMNGRELSWFNKKLNEAQRRAVRNVLRGEARPMPYVIFGPPGTGKTYTVLELILQIVTNIRHARLIVCASSNSAANLITERLISCKILLPGEFIRVVGLSAIDRNSIPEHLHPYCGLCDISLEGTTSNEIKVTENGLKMHCNTKFLADHKIIIGTCQALGSFMAMNFRPNHFTHLIVDEAGQCNEPETVIPMCLISPEKGQIILAGDPCQLGPQVLSTIAKDHGLGVSYLDRLLERFPYEKNYDRYEHGFDERLVTKLVNNYRSIPSVLQLYSDLSYDGKLVPTINDSDSDEIKFLDRFKAPLPAANRPTHGVFFFSNVGENRQQSDSPSWMNPLEAANVYSLILKLYKLGIKHEDIGVITPYKAQVQRIRFHLLNTGDEKIPKVGSVEEFQGQERNVIIVSTVRSSKSFLEHDFKHSMGFVKNIKRLNVAISRAKSLLVIFGNAHLLAHDPNWCHVIRYASANGAFHGELPAQISLDDI